MALKDKILEVLAGWKQKFSIYSLAKTNRFPLYQNLTVLRFPKTEGKTSGFSLFFMQKVMLVIFSSSWANNKTSSISSLKKIKNA